MKLFQKFSRIFTEASPLTTYDRRQVNPHELNSRNILTITFAGSILAVILAAITIKAASRPDIRGYMDGRDGFHFIAPTEYQLSGVMPRQIDNSNVPASQFVPQIEIMPRDITSPSDLNDVTISRSVLPRSAHDRYWARMDLRITPAVFAKLRETDESVVIHIPSIFYHYAKVTINGESWGSFANNDPIYLTIPRSMALNAPVEIKTTYSVRENGITFLDRKILVPPFVSTVAEAKRVQDYKVGKKDDSGGIFGFMSRIMIGVFALMLFLFIDSAPESLGLALLLGFEAMALALTRGWIDSHWNPFLIHFGSQMGDVFRLYFYLQLARLIKPNPTWWLIIGVALSIPYGMARQVEISWAVDGLGVIPRMRDMAVGTLGTIACLYTLWNIRGKTLPWRRVALILCAVGAFQQAIGPLPHYIPLLNQSENFRSFSVVFEALSAFILALSAFTNISTLENRVKNLSLAKARSDVIEQELELGRTVQRAFLHIPKLPADFEVVGSHDAAVFVSGDIYFVHWDEVEQRLAVVLSDVTGHGVQASLKATACFMVARSLWQSRAPVEGQSHRQAAKSRLKSFHRQSAELLSLFNETPDIATFAAMEIFPRAKKTYVYRNNFYAPIMVTPDEKGGWTVVIPAMKVAEVMDYPMKPGTVIALFSDGFIDGSRQLQRLKEFITARLVNFDGHAGSLKDMFTAFNDQNVERPVDDRTLLVITWKRDEYVASLSKTAV